ncbi:autotransporter domain-containing protein [Termitidicoccus mucosus]|uniref:Autotransporter domain-containing protein n=1 Tax=Termitidicoccus mucosus TaxID=1184151 RepID=A0A178IJ78_9BACT|nr:hypothetical protein AW736_14580 [Opitutaceae bacterium TSB47]
MIKFIIKSAPVFLLAVPAAPAAEIASPVTTSATVTLAHNETITTREIKVADGATLTILRTGSGGSLFPSLGTGTLAIGPVSEGGTGRVVFKDIYRNSAGGSILGITTDATVLVTGADFIGNSGGAGTAGVSGVFQINAGDAAITMRDVLFEDNFSYGNTGVSRVQNGTVLISGGTFLGNYALNAQIGVFGIQAATGRLTLDNVLFEANRAKTTSGVLDIGAFAYSATFTNVVFKDNWAGTLGGAIRAGHIGGELVFKMTAAGGTASRWSGNRAGLDGVTTAAVTANTAPVARAEAGGFYYAAGGGGARFDIDAGVSLAIGDPAASDKNSDSFASAATAGGTAAKIIKTGGGDLILNADNSYWRGSTEVSGGRLLLGNDGALLGSSTITVATAAAFGGLGKAANADAAGAANVMVSNGAALQVGVSDAEAGTFSIDGRLALDNATISYVASASGTSSRFDHNGVIIETGGTNILNMQAFASGTYNLGAITLYNTLIANGADTLRFAANGDITISDDARQGAKLISDASDFLVSVWTSQASRMKWTGPATGGAWNNSDNNWQGVNDPGVVKFASGDLVEFQADAAARSIDLASPVFVTGMLVDGDSSIAFTGAGGITASKYTSGDAEADVVASGSGQLVKRGSGALVFNNGANVFNGGVYIHGGAIEIQRGDQLQTGAAAVMFRETGTLRVSGSTQITNNIIIDPGKSAVLAAGGGVVTLSGSVSGPGTLVKDGAHALILQTANTHGATELRGGSLLVRHDQSLGTGALGVTGTSTLLGISAGNTIGNNINLNGNTLRVYNATSGGNPPGAVLSGAIAGGSLAVFGIDGPDTGPLLVAGANSLSAFRVMQHAKATAGHPGALGGATSAVSVEGGGSLTIGQPNTLAQSMRVYDGGKISFRNATASVPLLKLSGDLTFDEGSIVDLGAAPSGSIWLVDAASVTSNAFFEAGDAEISVTTDNGDLRVTKVNPATHAGKDVAAAFDAMTATTGAVYSRLGESFLMPIMGRRPGDPGRNFWIKGVGSFSDYDSAPGRVGFAGHTYGGMAGYDKLISSRLVVGGYIGYNYNSIKTDNHAETEAEMPYAGVYGAVKFGQLYFAADLMAGSIDADTSRFEQTGYAKGNYNAGVLGGGAEIGFVINPWKNGAIKPAFSVTYMGLDYKDQGENGPGAVLVDDFSADRWDSFMSVRVSQGFTLGRNLPAVIDFLFGWRAVLQADPAVITAQLSNNLGDKVRIGSTGEYRQAGCVAGLGLRFVLGARSTLAFAYDYENGQDHDRHSANASIRWNW